MVALMVTVCAELYVPDARLKVGAGAWGRLMEYDAELAVLVEYPLATTMACIVSEAETVIGPE